MKVCVYDIFSIRLKPCNGKHIYIYQNVIKIICEEI